MRVASPVEPPALHTDSLRERILDVCNLGNRFVGTEGERAARDFVAAEFQRAGLADVRLEEVPTLAYRPGFAACGVAGVLSKPSLPAVGLQFSASGEVEAEAAYLGSARSVADIEATLAHGLSVEGRIAVVDSYWPYAFARRLVELGAVGLVVVSPGSDGVIGHSTAQLYPPAEPPGFDGRPLAIPGVTIEGDAGRSLIALTAGGTRAVRIAHEATYSVEKTANVVGEVPGRELDEERVVVGAHYDTQLEGIGACDNATGIAALIEIAGSCVSRPLRRRTVFVAFADEEHGFIGSVAFCRRHADSLDRTVGMVCLDALAWAYPGMRSLHADPSLQAYAAARASELGWGPDEIVDASTLMGSDHNAFIDAGVPSCWFWRFPPQHPYYHASGDRPELLDFELVAETARVAAHTAFSLGEDAELRLGRSRPTKRLLELRPCQGETS